MSTTTSLIASTPRSTPTSTIQQKLTKPTLPPPSPGTWRHPHFTQLTSRTSRNSVSDRNVRNAAVNTTVLVLSLVLSSLLNHTLHFILSTSLSFINVDFNPSTTTYIIAGVRLLLLVNIAFALQPLIPYFKNKDELSDIPLTPSQRSLLGLPPSNASTPTSVTGPNYITPPRYRRSSGSFASSGNSTNSLSPPTTDRRSISATYASSKSSSRNNLGFSPSPFSPYRRSPLLDSQNSPSDSPLFPRGRDLNFRPDQSLSSSTGLGLGRSQSVRERGLTARGGRENLLEAETPSPPARVKRSPALNYKWLYEKGRLPKSESMQF